jgi:hypothetical protein
MRSGTKLFSGSSEPPCSCSLCSRLSLPELPGSRRTGKEWDGAQAGTRAWARVWDRPP